jgi:hypothetical protein
MALTLLGSNAGDTPLSLGVSVPANSGFILVIAYWFPIPGTFSVSDNVNTGNYKVIRAWQYPTSVTQWGLFAMQANATGDPTVALSSPDAGQLLVLGYSGLAGLLTFPASDYATNTTTVAGTAVNSGSFNTSVPAEYALGVVINSATASPNFIAASPFGSLITSQGAARTGIWETSQQFGSGMSIGTSVALTGTDGTSVTRDASVFGFYDQAIIYTPFTQTQFFVTDTIVQQ